MKQFMIRRVLPVVLTISILLPSFVVPAVAATFPDEYRDRGSVTDWELEIQRPNTVLANALANALGVSNATNALFWSCVNMAVADYGEVARVYLEQLCREYNYWFTVDMAETFRGQLKDAEAAIAGNTLAHMFGLGRVNFEVQEHPSSGLLRIKETTNDLWVVDQGGRYPYVDPTLKEGSGGDYWETVNDVYKNVIRGEGPGGHFVSKGSLESTKDYLVQKGFNCWIAEIGGSGMMGITKSGYFLCDSEGRPYFCWEQDYQAVVNQDRPTSEIVTESGEQVDVPEDMEVELDIDNNFVLLPTGDTAIIGEVIYDASEKIYHVETHKVKNYTNIDYETTVNNYTYEYYVQNTTVTYIGETMDYEKYECYYKLPDGRSSADLTKEELEQLNVGIDVVEYSRSTDDVRLRALYHFDGDTKDSSYWNHLSEFEWSMNASITYMDVETFGGAIYFDPNVYHVMHMKLPTALGTGDWTIQFRYYQGQATAEDNTSGLYLNGTPLANNRWTPKTDGDAIRIMGFDGTNIVEVPDEDGESRTREYSIGSWNEFCLTCEDGALTYYINGLPILLNRDMSGTSFNEYLTFCFSTGSGAYKMFDELRVLNYAIASGLSSYYEPTAVPHDTNLALVLPEDKVAIADEYWTFESSKENLLEQYGLADWQDFGYRDVSPYLDNQGTAKFSEPDENGYATVVGNSYSSFPVMFYNSNYYELEGSSSGVVISAKGDYSDYSLGGFADVSSSDGVSHPFSGLNLILSAAGSSFLADGDYNFSVVFSTGDVAHFPFSISSGVVCSLGTSSTIWIRRISSGVPGGILFGLYLCRPDGTSNYQILSIGGPVSGDSTPIVYMELVEGGSTDLTPIYNGEIAIVDKDDQFKPTLAVKTDLEIIDYQIGGVRPSIPSKGLVYAMVESGYITSLQIYNGQAWEACDGRIWTGQRWIPYSSYNVITLQDMYDVVDATPGYEYIYSEAGFWAWWQKSWNEFKEQLFSILNNIAGNVGEDSGLDEPFVPANPEEEDNLSFLEFIVLLIDGGRSVLGGFRTLFSGVVSSVPDAIQVFTGAFEPGGIAVGMFDGTYKDPDLEVMAVMDLDSLDYYQTEEVLDPWRYR